MPYHFGKAIRQVIKDRGMTVAEFARRANMSRENAYSVFKREDLDTGLIRAISEVLKHDFLAESLSIIKAKKAAEPTAELKQQIKVLRSEIGELHDGMRAIEKLVKHKRK